MIEPASRTEEAPRHVDGGRCGGGEADAGAGSPTGTVAALGMLVLALDQACEELFAAVPFLGDQDTGAVVNAYVDEVVGALRGVRAEADDLRRVMSIAGRR